MAVTHHGTASLGRLDESELEKRVRRPTAPTGANLPGNQIADEFLLGADSIVFDLRRPPPSEERSASEGKVMAISTADTFDFTALSPDKCDRFERR